MIFLRGLLALCGLTLAGLIVYAIQSGDFWQAGSWLTTDPWGMTTLFDLYLGMALCAIVIAFFERGWSAVFWIAPLPFLGNIWTVLWFVYRLPNLAKRLRNAV